MNRRDTVLALLALGAGPLAARAQQTDKTYRVGYIVTTTPIGEMAAPIPFIRRPEVFSTSCVHSDMSKVET